MSKPKTDLAKDMQALMKNEGFSKIFNKQQIKTASAEVVKVAADKHYLFADLMNQSKNLDDGNCPAAARLVLEAAKELLSELTEQVKDKLKE